MSVQKFTREFLQADEESRLEAPCGPQAEDLGVERLESRTCCGCGCLCDDISYQFDAGRVVKSLNLCELGWKRLQEGAAASAEAERASGQELEDALERAAEILRTHSPVLFLGAEFLDEEAQRASLRLARAVRGIWVPWSYEAVKRFHQIACRWGWATALLDDVRDHGEVVIFWRCDPLVTHHRHLSRYSYFARGRFTERGHHDRNLAAVGEKGSRIERLCRQFLELPRDRDADLVEGLRPGSPRQGFEHRELEALRKACEQSGYVAIFVDPEIVDERTLETLFLWSAETNRAAGARRMVVLPLYRTGPNVEGFFQVSIDACGVPWGVDFREGEARPVRADWQELEASVGCVLLLYPEGRDESRPLPLGLGHKPRVVLDPFGSSRVGSREVRLQVALAGLGSEGVFFRSDGVPLRVSALPGYSVARVPSARTLLGSLAARIF